MKIGFASAALLLLFAFPARSLELERGEWRRVGESFACKVGAPRPLAPGEVTPEAMLLACMHMGPFQIGAAARTLEATLGPPHRTLPQPKETQAFVWFLGERDHYPYFIGAVRSDKITALQVTGSTAHPKAYGFNHVTLGDSTATLTKFFGPAFRISKSELPETDVWHYGPWPFSFEVKAGQVTSIRIADPSPAP
jgi:hypothetical protein